MLMTNVLDNAQRDRLFWASCLALISTSIAFGVITGSMASFESTFSLDLTQVGWIGGAALGGFAIAIILLGPVIDKIGISNAIRIAFFCHLIGTALMVTAGGFAQLMAGATVLALGNGAVEAGCNPLVATIYPDNKTTKLNQFHVFWPVGIIIGGLWAFWINNASAAVAEGGAAWSLFGLSALQAKLAVVVIPTLIYGYLFKGQKIPQTERVQSNVSDQQVMESVKSPLFMLMLFCMMLTATLELGPGRWMDSIMSPAVASAGIAENGGILVLIYGSGLMALLRYNAGGFVSKFSPTGLLVFSAILGGLGLFGMTFAENFAMIFVTATVFYLGVCFFWPTMLGFIAEQIPRSGALGLCLMGGVGMLAVGYVTAPMIGWIQEYYSAAQVAAGAAAADAATYGGKMAFRYVAASGIVLAAIFWKLHKQFGQGGYSSQSISSGSSAQSDPVQETAGV